MTVIINKKDMVYGVGINDAEYSVHEYKKINGRRKTVWRCPYYNRWIDILKRCYSKGFHSKNPTYKGCTVSEEWLIFSNFRDWMIKQNWEGKQLDKDLLFEGNKIYNPETCVL